MSLKFIKIFVLILYAFSLPAFGYLGNLVLPHHAKTTQQRHIRYKVDVVQNAQFHLVIFAGRASFIEKYDSDIEALKGLGGNIWRFDWPGHGGSYNTHTDKSHPHKTHIHSFDAYQEAAHAIITRIRASNDHKPIIIFGSSMGGQVALQYMHDHPRSVDGAFLECPMFDVKTAPIPRWIAPLVTEGLCFLGYCEHYAFGYGDYDPSRDTFETNYWTDDRATFEERKKMINDPRNKNFVRGGVTFDWASAMFKAFDLQNHQDYPETMPPILILKGSHDNVVNFGHLNELCARIPHCRYITLKNTRHSPLKASGPVRATFLAHVRDFLKELKLVPHNTYVEAHQAL